MKNVNISIYRVQIHLPKKEKGASRTPPNDPTKPASAPQDTPLAPRDVPRPPGSQDPPRTPPGPPRTPPRTSWGTINTTIVNVFLSFHITKCRNTQIYCFHNLFCKNTTIIDDFQIFSKPPGDILKITLFH